MSTNEDIPRTESGVGPTLSEHNAVAVFDGMDGARAAIDALERAGVEAAHISLLGPAAARAAEHTDTRDRDAEVVDRVGGRTAAGAIGGSAVGGVTGFLAGLAAFGIPGVGPVIGAGIWAATIGGAVAGGAVGGMVGGYSALGMTPAYELTFETVRSGRTLVGVHGEDPAVVERGAEVLAGLEPIRLERFDREGRRVGV